MKTFVLSAVIIAGCVSSTLTYGLEIGDKAPAFSLPGTDGKTHALADSADAKATVIVITCNHCPVAKAYEQRLIQVAKDYTPKQVAFVAINPNDDKAYPADSFEEMKKRASDKGYPFPYLRDADSSVARAYGAKVTPHVFVADSKGVVQYIGRIDDSMDEAKIKRQDLREALDDILAGEDVEVNSTKAFGCSIKWAS